jgi:uncharacterized UBP type Zn finger protein
MSGMTPCSHLADVQVLDPPASIAGCEECLRIGSAWVHLRMCLTCGKVGCCDSSPNRHASGHAREPGHAIARSVEPGETWAWCFVDEVPFLVTPDGLRS